MQPAPSLAFALQKARMQEPKILCHSPEGQRTPHSQVATPARSVHFTHSPMHGAGITPVATPHHNAGQATAVSVIAPGGGTGINGAVYAELGQDPHFAVDVVGRSRAPYDCYPEYWPNGGPAPNLHTFAEDVVRQGWAEKTDCFVFGSRGGQVVLPVVWQHKGDAMPPTVCINGGCAMRLPRPVRWPDNAITFLLIGGEDYFRGNASTEEYIAETKAQVPAGNGTTAILFVKEMQHMPQQALLRVVLPLMLKAIMNWQMTDVPPREELRLILQAVNRDGWSGRLLYTQGPSNWAPSVDFGPFMVTQHIGGCSPAVGAHHDAEPIEISRKQELKALFRAAALAAQPSRGAPLANPADRFHAAVQAAAKCQQAAQMAPQPEVVERRTKRTLTLPIPAAGSPVEGRSRANSMNGLSPSGARTPKTPSRLAPPGVRFGNQVPTTPCSRALGMAGHISPSAQSMTSLMSDGSPIRQRVVVY